MKIQTQSVHFNADAKLLEFVDKKLSKLEQFYDRIIDAAVIMKLENTGQVRDKVVEVVINVPGKPLVVKETNKTFEAAIDKAADVLKRQLVRTKEKMKGKRA